MPGPKKHALLIATSEYRDGRLSSLPLPGRAHAELADALKDSEGGGFARVESLVNGNLSQVLHALDRFFSLTPREDLALVYFSGLGVVDAQGEIFLALRDSDRYRLKSTALMAGVMGMNVDLCLSPRKILILDCRFHALFLGEGKETARLASEKVFSGRGLPKAILSASDRVRIPERHDTAETEPDFTRTLAATLRPAPDRRAAERGTPFTLEDWWSAVLAQYPERAVKPLLHRVGIPPEFILKGTSPQRQEFAMSSVAARGETQSGPARQSGPDASHEDNEWSQMSDPIPLDLIDPDFAALAGDPPAADPEPAEGKGIPEAASAADPAEVAPEAGFTQLLAKMEAQEEVEKHERLQADLTEAEEAQRLEKWKSEWKSRSAPAVPAPTFLAAPDAGMLAEMQKTIFFVPPDAEGTPEPPKPEPVLSPFGSEDSMTTMMVSRDEFIGELQRLRSMEPAPAPPAPPSRTPTTVTPALQPAAVEEPEAAAKTILSVPAVQESRTRKTEWIRNLEVHNSSWVTRTAWIFIGLLPIILILAVYAGIQGGLIPNPGDWLRGGRPQVPAKQKPAWKNRPQKPEAPDFRAAPALPAAPARNAAGDEAARTETSLKASVQEAMQANAGDLQAVYERYSLGFPGLAGEVVLNLLVDPSGRIMDVTLKRSTTGVSQFDREILRKARSWRIGPFPGKEAKLLTIPLRFPNS